MNRLSSDKLKDEKLIPRTLHAMIGSDGHTRYLRRMGATSRCRHHGSDASKTEFEGNFEQKQADLGDQLLMDVVVSGAGKPQAIPRTCPG